MSQIVKVIKKDVKGEIPGLFSIATGWYDVSQKGQEIKYIYCPGDAVRLLPIYQEYKEETETNLKKTIQIIKQKLNLVEKTETSKNQEQEKNKIKTKFEFNPLILKTYDLSTIYKGESFMEDGIEYRKDGSIIFTKENEAYKRLWNMSLYWGNEEMAIITPFDVLMLPGYSNRDDRSRFFEYGYLEKDMKVIDALTNKLLTVVALIHTHPNGSAPSGWRGDGSFIASHFPLTPMYVLPLSKKDSSIHMIYSKKSDHFSWDPGGTGFSIPLAFHNPSMIIENLFSSKISLKDFSLNNKTFFKQKLP